MAKRNGEFDKLVLKFRKDPSVVTGRKLGEAFVLLAADIIAMCDAAAPHYGDGWDCNPRRAAMHCFERMGSFDPEKGCAFNYFCTLMLNWMRKDYKEHSKRLDQEKAYGVFLPQ